MALEADLRRPFAVNPIDAPPVPWMGACKSGSGTMALNAGITVGMAGLARLQVPAGLEGVVGSP